MMASCRKYGLDSKTYKLIYDMVSKRYRRYNKDKNWKTKTVINGLNFREALEQELKIQVRRRQLGITRHEKKVKPRPKEIEFPKPYTDENVLGLVHKPEPYEPIEDDTENRRFNPNEMHGLRTSRKSDNVGFDNLADLLKAVFGSPYDEQHEKDMKQLKHQVNDSLERQTLRNICPICRSSVCRCGQNG